MTEGWVQMLQFLSSLYFFSDSQNQRKNNYKIQMKRMNMAVISHGVMGWQNRFQDVGRRNIGGIMVGVVTKLHKKTGPASVQGRAKHTAWKCWHMDTCYTPPEFTSWISHALITILVSSWILALTLGPLCVKQKQGQHSPRSLLWGFNEFKPLKPWMYLYPDYVLISLRTNFCLLHSGMFNIIYLCCPSLSWLVLGRTMPPSMLGVCLRDDNSWSGATVCQLH